MKQCIMTFFAVCLFLLFSQSLMSTSYMTSRQEELEYALEVSERHALENALIDRAYDIETEEELYAEFLAEFFECFEPKGPVRIDLYEIDLQKGILDLSVEEDLTIFGKAKSLAARRCVGLEILSGKNEGA